MIYDTFIFFNEFELLKLRLKELEHIVDKFIIVESTCTHSGQEKPLNLFTRLGEDFAQWRHKIIYKATDTKALANPWLRERAQRNVIGTHDFKDTDIIIFSDVDEIPNATAIDHFMDLQCMHYAALQTANYRFKLNLFEELGNNIRIMTGLFAKSEKFDFDNIRKRLKPVIVITQGGWHFTYLGDENELITKLQSFAHCEDKEIKDLIYDVNLHKGLNMTFPFAKQTKVPIDDTFPKTILNNLAHYKNLNWIAL